MGYCPTPPTPRPPPPLTRLCCGAGKTRRCTLCLVATSRATPPPSPPALPSATAAATTALLNRKRTRQSTRTTSSDTSTTSRTSPAARLTDTAPHDGQRMILGSTYFEKLQLKAPIVLFSIGMLKYCHPDYVLCRLLLLSGFIYL